jgi:hypothetical protein
MKGITMPKIISPTSTYWESLKILCKDLESSYRYVQPDIIHFPVYSLRYYELLLRACTEFESLCSEKVKEYGLIKKKGNLTIKDYYLLEARLNLSKYAVGFYFDPILFVSPLANWGKDHKLTWYQDYNTVKHNRVAEFHKANFENVLNAVAALFILITQTHLCPSGNWAILRSGGQVTSHEEWPLILKRNDKSDL